METPVSSMKVSVGPPGHRRASGLRECGLARFPFLVVRRGGRTATDVVLSDCQYRKGTALCMADAEFGIQVIVEAVVACPEPEHCHLFSSESLV